MSDLRTVEIPTVAANNIVRAAVLHNPHDWALFPNGRTSGRARNDYPVPLGNLATRIDMTVRHTVALAKYFVATGARYLIWHFTLKNRHTLKSGHTFLYAYEQPFDVVESLFR